MRFADFVCFDATIPEVRARDRDGAIRELVEALVDAGSIRKRDSQAITKALIKRENEASTGLGKGVAVPHVKHPAVKDVVGAVGRSSRGIDFSSLDKQPVYSVILLISPVDEPEKHLEAMEKVLEHLQKDNFRKFLRQLQTAEAINDLLTEADEKVSL